MPASRAILCVDDESIILLSMKAQLKARYGARFRYETAAGGEEALRVIETLHACGTRIIVILSDWLMPGMNGDEFARRVKQEHPDISILLVTGYAAEESVKRALGEGFIAGCIPKPWTSSAMYGAIDGIIESFGEE